MADTFYLWSPYRNGGEVKEVKTPNGGSRVVVAERNVTPAGEKVTKGTLGVDDAEWDSLIEAGVVRTYPFPEMPAGSADSPVVFLQKKVANAAQSEEERLMAEVAGAISTDEQLVAASAEAMKVAKAEDAKK